ncbi:MAG: hypothetical protein R3301_12795 [Saprospiraceae bacterium]|nr:hypothetical protein [Saprospiraceae bacterium]
MICRDMSGIYCLVLVWCCGWQALSAQDGAVGEDTQWAGISARYDLPGDFRIATAHYAIFKDGLNEKSWRSEFGVQYKPLKALTLSARYTTVPNPDEFDRQTLSIAAKWRVRWKDAGLALYHRVRFDHSRGMEGYEDFLRNAVSLRYTLSSHWYAEAGLEPFLEFGEVEDRLSRYDVTVAVRHQFASLLWLKPYYRYRKVGETATFSDYRRWGLRAGFPIVAPARKNQKSGLTFELRLHLYYTTRS